MSPTSPRSSGGVDNTSYHGQGRSSDQMSEAGSVERGMEGMEDEGGFDEGAEEVDEVDDLGAMQEMDDPRLSRISVSSWKSFSLVSS